MAEAEFIGCREGEVHFAMMIEIRNADFSHSEENGITSSWERISRRRGPQLFFIDNWMEAKATAPLYEWKPSSPITLQQS